MKIKLSEEVITSVGAHGPGEIFLPREEALSLIREGKASLMSPPARFVASGRGGYVDRIIKALMRR